MSDCNCQLCIPAKWRGLTTKPAPVKLVFEDGWVVTRGRRVVWASLAGLIGTEVNFQAADLLGLGETVMHNVQTLRVLDCRARTGS